jgi:hypothetical protein
MPTAAAQNAATTPPTRHIAEIPADERQLDNLNDSQYNRTLSTAARRI